MIVVWKSYIQEINVEFKVCRQVMAHLPLLVKGQLHLLFSEYNLQFICYCILLQDKGWNSDYIHCAIVWLSVVNWLYSLLAGCMFCQRNPQLWQRWQRWQRSRKYLNIVYSWQLYMLPFSSSLTNLYFGCNIALPRVLQANNIRTLQQYNIAKIENW